MKTIKIRFIEYEKNKFSLEIKKWYGWIKFKIPFNLFQYHDYDFDASENSMVIKKSKKSIIKKLKKELWNKKTDLKIVIFPTIKIK